MPDHIAGTELYTQMVARRLTDAGHAAAVFTPLNREGQFEPTPALEAGVRVYRVPVGERGATGIFLSTFGRQALSEAFAAVLAAERPDVVHLQHLLGGPAAVGQLAIAAAVSYTNLTLPTREIAKN